MDLSDPSEADLLRRRRPFLAPMVATAVLVVAIATGCGDSGPGEGEASKERAGTQVPSETSTSTPVSAASFPSTAPAEGATGSTIRRPGAVTTPTINPSTITSMPSWLQPRTPPAPGTYRYDTTGTSSINGSPQPLPAVTTLAVDPAAGSRQHSVRDLRDGSGNGSATEMTLYYRAEGMFLEELKVVSVFGGVSQVRTLRGAAPLLLLPTGAVPGQHLEMQLSVIGGSGGVATVKGDVLRPEPVTIGGTTLDALVVKAVLDLPPSDITAHVELTVWLHPSTGLFLRDESVSDATAAAGLFRVHTEYRATLQRLP